DLVLIPSDLLASNSEENLCKEIRSWRQTSRELVANLVKAKELMSTVYQRFGVKLDAEGGLERARHRVEASRK
ncbi:MAG: hypothetical protein ACHQ53_04465, partial [Polyangiales bacterium]